MPPQRTKIIECRKCHRKVTVPHPDNQGHPYGWYQVSVRVPPWFNGVSERLYRYIGLFCSVGCLMAHEDELIRMRELEGGAYEAE